MYYLIIVASILIFANPAHAVQVHGPPEGLYVHIIAHIFFSSAIIFLLYLFKRHPPGKGPPWRFLKLSLFMFLLWNIDTLIVHILSIGIPEAAIHMPKDIFEHALLPPITIKEILFYILRNDHLLCVPAMLFLVLSLKSFLAPGPGQRERGYPGDES